jgi:hypothetical protein
MLLLAALAGCAAPVPAPPPAPAGPPPGIEGRYRGTARLVRSSSRFCPRSGPRVYELENGQVTLAYSTAARPGARPDRVPLTAQVQADGAIQTTDGTGTMDGTLHDGVLEITIASALCEHRWTMKKVP